MSDMCGEVLEVDKSSPAQTDKKKRLSLSVLNYIDLIHGEHCADSLRDLYFICLLDKSQCSANRPKFFPRQI